MAILEIYCVNALAEFGLHQCLESVGMVSDEGMDAQSDKRTLQR